MPGKHREIYATTTLFICIFTTVVCGGLTDRMLTRFGMKQMNDSEHGGPECQQTTSSPTSRNRPNYSLPHRTSHRVYKGAKRLWKQIDRQYLKHYFGGSTAVASAVNQGDNHLGQYELSCQQSDSDDEDSMIDDFEDHLSMNNNQGRSRSNSRE